jgi:hypothetical protein
MNDEEELGATIFYRQKEWLKPTSPFSFLAPH